MANKKITGLPSASEINNSDQFELAQSCVSKRTAWSLIKSVLKTYFDTIYSAVYVNGNGTTVNGNKVDLGGDLTKEETLLVLLSDGEEKVFAITSAYNDGGFSFESEGFLKFDPFNGQSEFGVRSTIDATKISLIGVQTEENLFDLFIKDDRDTPTGLKYFGNYEATFEPNSLITKAFVEGRYWNITGGNVVSGNYLVNGGSFVIIGRSVPAGGAALEQVNSGLTNRAAITSRSSSSSNKNAVIEVVSTQTSNLNDINILIRNASSGFSKGFTLQDHTKKGIQVVDTLDSCGLSYSSDYSTNGITEFGDRWVPDRGYVDGVMDDHLLNYHVPADAIADSDGSDDSGKINEILAMLRIKGIIAD